MKKFVWIAFLSTMFFTGCSQQFSTSYTDKKNISSYTNSYSINAQEQKMEDKSYTGTLEFEGMDTLWSYEAEKDCTVDISYLLSVTAGKAKLVLIAPDETVATIVEITDKMKQPEKQETKLSLPKGFNRIKLVTEENTALSLEFHCELGELEKLGI